MGFFTTGELSKSAKQEVDVDSLEPDCIQCGLYKKCFTPKMPVAGEGKKEILIISEFPSDEDDEYGIPLVDEKGQILKNKLRANDISIMKDCWRINAVNCKKSDGLIPTQKEIKACNPLVEKAILQLKPKLIILLGSIAINSILGEEFSDRSVDRWRNYIIPDEKYKCWILPIYHPWQLERNEFDKNLESVFDRDLKRIKTALNKRIPGNFDYEQYVAILTDFSKVKKLLERIIQRKSKIMFDYETTGLKPHRQGHKIVSIGIGVSATKAFAFPYDYKTFWTPEELKEIKRLWKKILKDKAIKKMAHNHKFEDSWSRVRAGARPKGWYWDPMMGEHILDNRSKSTGLKFLTYVHFGVRPYDKHIHKFLDSGKGEFNTIEKAPFKELLIYNGLDCIFAWMLYEKEKKRFNGMHGLSRAYKFFMRGLYTMGTIQNGGICVNEKYYKKANIDLTKRIQDLEKYLTSGREAKKFQKQFGRPLKITSNPDLGKLFYDVLGKPVKYTEKGSYKTDKATIESLNLPFVDKLLEMKRLEKAKGTYLAQFAREIHKGKMYPFFDLHIPKTYRSSSSMPNFQNLPKRDPEIGNIVRKGLIPSPGCVICEADFSGAEVITSVCVTGDTKLETINGSKTIKQIIKRIKTHEVFVYGYCLNEKRIKIAPITRGGLTGKKKEVWKVTLDNGEIIKATPNHKFMIRNGSKHEGKYVELRELKEGMSLMPFYKKEKNGYYYINLNNRKSLAEHTLIGKDVLGYDVGGSYDSDVIHHKDGDGLNNKLSNLERMTRKNHTSLHHKGKVTGPHSEEHKKKISKSMKGVPCPQRAVKWTPEKLKNLSEGLKGREFSDEHKQKLSNNKKEYWKNKEEVECKVCGKEFKSITNTHLLNAHNMTLEEYKSEYNHKVVSVEFYGYEDVYNINVEGIHNYATSAGVILKNCYHKDRNFYNYLVDPSTDMHRDNASDLLMLPEGMLIDPLYTDAQKKLAKMIRFFAKNNWTFAQFYGDWFASCGSLFWENVVQSGLKLPNDVTVKNWLESKGIFELGEVDKNGPTPGSFLEHCKEVERKMWYERFPEYTAWKQDIVDFYQKYGYIETFFGFRFVGYMDRKQCTNYPIQGTSFHLLVYTLIEVERFIIRNKLKTKLIGQIHDSILADVPKEELQFYLKGVHDIVTNLKNKFKWLIVPMEIEAEISRTREEGGNFAEMKEIDPLKAELW